jgi:hypothetical protein
MVATMLSYVDMNELCSIMLNNTVNYLLGKDQPLEIEKTPI